VSRRALLCASLNILTCVTLALAQSPVSSQRATSVSLIRLIANPQIFDNHRLRLAGFLDYNGPDRGVGLYVTALDGQNFIISNSVDLRGESADEKLIHKYVIIEGTYHAPKGPLADYVNGYLDHVSVMRIVASGDVPK
jgi:hypothetical protein